MQLLTTIIKQSQKTLMSLTGHSIDVIEIAKPTSLQMAISLTKIISKLSPLISNLIEYRLIDILNEDPWFYPYGTWIRQDPGFPDTILHGTLDPIPGIEIKCWFPLSTEITARFKDSQQFFKSDNTYVALLAWVPEYIIFGKPKIINLTLISGKSIAEARDNYYYNPPHYLIIEPEDTRLRTSNLQQTNVNGYKWQGSIEQLAIAQQIVDSWDSATTTSYSITEKHQQLVQVLMSQYPYRLDTNFAKLDRIFHPQIQAFKQTTLQTSFQGKTLAEWKTILFQQSLDQNSDMLNSLIR